MLRTDSASFSSSVHVDEQRLAVDAEPLQQLGGRLRLDLARGQRVDDDQRAVLQLLRERRAQRAALDLLRQLVVVAARLRAEHGAALAPQRVADLADARAAGALLPPRLLAAAADERAVLRRVRAAALRRVRVHDRFPDQVGRSRGRRTPRRCTSTRADLLVLAVDDIELSWLATVVALSRRPAYFLPFFGFSTCATLIFFAVTALRTIT